MSVKDLREALHGPKGAMDNYLELCGEAEIKADILALCGNDDRKTFAAMAMQGIVNRQQLPEECATAFSDWYQRNAVIAVGMADALIRELAT